MILNHKKIVTLASMGIVRDNIDTLPGDSQIVFVPSNDCLVYVPSIAKIRNYVVTLDGTTYTDEEPDVHALYLNEITHRLYSWNGVNMMMLLNTNQGMEQIVDATDFSQPNKVYHVTTEHYLTSSLTIGEGSTVVFHGEGKFVGAAIEGLDIQFIPDGDSLCFGTGCSFTNLHPCASWLKATNFGAISDMTVSEPIDWTFKGFSCKIQQRSGTNNNPIWSMIESFLNYSKTIKMEFNGKFYSHGNNATDCALEDDLNVVQADNLELCGGIIMFFLYITDSNCVHIHHMSFVGFHKPHDFPTVCNEKSDYIHDHPEMENNCYEVDYDTRYACGLGYKSIHVQRSDNPSHSCEGIHIEFCHFEMRQSGVCGHSQYSNGTVIAEMTDLHVNDCSFDHIYFQPVGSHCECTVIERVFSNYCLQGLDISTCAHGTTVKDCIFVNNACGPKQDTESPGIFYKEYSHDNLIENCLFTMTDRYNLINAARYAISSNWGTTNDEFKVLNCKFIINSEFEYDKLVYCRCHNMLFDNCTFEFNITPPRSDWKLATIFCSGGHAPRDPETGIALYVPHIKLINCNLTSNASAYYLASYYGDLIDFEIENSNIQCGDFIHAIPKCHNLSIKSCILDFPCHIFVQDTPTISVTDSVFLCDIGFSCFNLVGPYNLDVTIENNVFKSAARFVNLNSNDNGTVNIHSNVISCILFINQPSDSNTTVNQSGNVIN